MKKKWNVKIDGRNLDQTEVIDTLLESRGIDDVTDFLHPSDDDMLPLEKLRNIDKAAQVILNGVDDIDSAFLVYFDTDSDGCTAGRHAHRTGSAQPERGENLYDCFALRRVRQE